MPLIGASPAAPSPSAFRAEDLDHARGILDALLSEAADVERPGGYAPRSEDDPGRILLVLLIAATRRIAFEAADAARRAAMDGIFRQAIGSPRPARPGRVPVALDGAAGTLAGPNAEASSRDGRRVAVLGRSRPIALFEITAIAGLVKDGPAIPLAVAPANGPDQERTPSPFAPLLGLRVDLAWGPLASLPAGSRPAMLAWDASPAMARRLTRATLLFESRDPAPTRALFDLGGRPFVVLRGADGRPPTGVLIEFESPIAPADQRRLGRWIPNVAIAREARDAPDRPALHSLTPRRRGAGLAPSPLFAGWPSRAAETVAAWRRRAARSLRPGGPAATLHDLHELLAREHPEVRVLDIAACRAGRRDGVRVAIWPARFEGPGDALDGAVALAPRVRATLERHLPDGVAARVGSPFWPLGRESVGDDDPLRPHLDRLAPPGALVARDHEGIEWPVDGGGRGHDNP